MQYNLACGIDCFLIFSGFNLPRKRKYACFAHFPMIMKPWKNTSHKENNIVSFSISCKYDKIYIFFVLKISLCIVIHTYNIQKELLNL